MNNNAFAITEHRSSNGTFIVDAASDDQRISHPERRCAMRSNRSFNRSIFIDLSKVACGEYF